MTEKCLEMNPLVTSYGDEAYNVTTTEENQEIKLIFTLPANFSCSRLLMIIVKFFILLKDFIIEGVFWNGSTDRSSMRPMIGKEDIVQT